MHQIKKLSIAIFSLAALMSAEAPADAARGRSQSNSSSRTASRTIPPRTRSPRTRATRANVPSRRTSPLKDSKHLASVKKLANQWKKWTLEGQPNSRKTEYFFHAATAELVSTRGTKQTEVRPVNYGKHSQRLRVTGVKNGKWRGHLIGTVSVHDLASLNGAAYQKAVKDRVASDRVRVSYDYGPGTAKKVLKKGVKSDVVTTVALEVPLNPKKNGVTRIIYDRTNASGSVVGASDAYEGRIVELVQ